MSGYPSKPGLSKFEAEQVRDHGANPSWFEPWAQHVVLFPGVAAEAYGYIHMHGLQESYECDVSTWDSQEGLSRGLEALYRSHSQCDKCRGVLYFTPDEPRMHVVPELNDLEDEEADQ